jgi:hypothetical protein
VSARSHLRRVYGKPFALATLSGFGLIAALLADGIWDAASWIGLSTIAAVIAWFILRPHPAVNGEESSST